MPRFSFQSFSSQLLSLGSLVGAQTLTSLGLGGAGAIPAALTGVVGVAAGVGQGIFAASLWERIRNRHAAEGDLSGDPDLTRCIAETVAELVREHGETEGRGGDERARIAALADRCEGLWDRLVRWPGIAALDAGDVAPVRASRAAELLATGADGLADVRALTPEVWEAMLRFLARRGEPLDLGERTLRALAVRLHEGLAAGLRARLVADAGSEGLAYASVQLNLLGDLVATCQATRRDLAATEAEQRARLDALAAAAAESARRLCERFDADRRERYAPVIRRFDHLARQLEGMEERILGSVRALRGLAPETPLRSLPPADPTFRLRDELLTRVHDELSRHPRVVLHGLPGVGKTETAVHYAHRFADSYHDVLWVSAESAESLQRDFAAIADGLGLVLETPSTAQARVLAQLATRRNWLLVVDNADEPERMRRVLDRATGGKVLLTARPQPPASWGRPVPVDPFDRRSAASLLLQLAERIEGDAAWADLEPDEREAALELADEVSGLALSLAHLAALLRETHLAAAALLGLYRERGSELRARADARLLREHPSVAVTFSLALERVADPAARELILLLAHLAPEPVPFDLLARASKELDPALRAAVDDPLAWPRVQAAAAASALVDVDARRGTLRMHRLVQAASLDSLDEARADAYRARSLDVVAAGFPEPKFETAAACADALPHALLVLEQAHAAGDERRPVLRLLLACGTYLDDLAAFSEARELLERALDLCERTCDPDAEELAEALNQLGKVVYTTGPPALCRELTERALEIRRRADPPVPKHVATSLNNLGMVLWSLGEYERGRELVEEALELRERESSIGDDDRANSHGNFGEILLKQGEPAPALEHLERELALRRSEHGPDHPSLARAMLRIAWARRDLGDAQAAQETCEEALALIERLHSPDHPDAASAIAMLADFQKEDGRVEEAGAHLERAMELRTRAFGPEHPIIATTLGSLAEVEATRDLIKAVAHRERALSVIERFFGPDHPETADTLMSLANTLVRAHELARALELSRRALAIREAHFGADSVEAAGGHNQIGWILGHLGDDERSFEHYHRSLTLRREHHGEEHADTALGLHNCAHALLNLDRAEEAVTYFRRAAALREKLLGPDAQETGFTFEGLGGALSAVGRDDEALAATERGFAVRQSSPSARDADTVYVLSQLAVQRAATGDLTGAVSARREAVERSRELFGPAHGETAVALALLAEACRDAGDEDEAERRIQEATEICADADDADLGYVTLELLASLQENVGQADAALVLRRRAFEDRTRVLGDSHPDTVLRLVRLAGAQVRAEREQEAAASVARLAALLAASDSCVDALGDDLSDLAERLYDLQRPELPRSLAEPMVAALERSGGDRASLARMSVLLATLERDADRPDEAASWLERAAGVAEAEGSDGLPLLARIALALGHLLREQERFGDALPQFERSAAAASAAHDEDPALLADVLLHLGSLLSLLERTEEAQPHLSRATDLVRREFGEEHVLYKRCLVSLAVLHRRRKDFEAAREVLDELAALTPSPSPEEQAGHDMRLGLLHRDAERTDEAAACFERVRSTNEDLRAPALFHLASLEHRRGRSDQAARMFEECLARLEDSERPARLLAGRCHAALAEIHRARGGDDAATMHATLAERALSDTLGPDHSLTAQARALLRPEN